MNIEQIRKFVKKVNYNQDIRCVVVNKPNKHPLYIFKRIAKKVTNIRVIYINNYSLKFNSSILKSLLMHEVGHLHDHFRAKVACEYHAQVWAINRAIELGWVEMSEKLVYQIVVEWAREKWHYKKASRKFVERWGKK